MSDTCLFSYPAGILLQYFPDMFEGSLQIEMEDAITRATAEPFKLDCIKPIGGGCINTTYSFRGTDGRQFFAKENDSSFLPVFEIEAEALHTIAATGTIRVPIPVATCCSNSSSALIMELLPISSHCQNWSQLGSELARLHRNVGEAFGWKADNWIGSTVQINTLHATWPDFYVQCRLLPQIRQARSRGLALSQAESLLKAVPTFFKDYSPPPSLLHGDLWAGNASFLEDASPVIYDPASYFGDREADLALTELFGGFPREFYDAYGREWPIDPDYTLRKDLYNLYHVLNHFNIFGGGYGSQADSIINRLLSSLDN